MFIGPAPEATADAAAVGTATAPARRKRLRSLRNPKCVVGVGIMAFFVVIALIGGWLAPYDPSALGPDLLQPPSAKHWLGTTHMGQDVLSQLLVGTRSVLVVGFVAGIVATTLSVLVGVTAGFLGGGVDEVLSAVANIFLVIPGLPLVIIVAGQLPNASAFTVALVLASTGWAWGRGSFAPRRCRCAAETSWKRRAPTANRRGASSASRRCPT